MKAGRELDALVAEKVMRWKPHVNKQGITEWCEPSKKISLVGTVLQTEDFFCPSLDIGVAWSVVEKLGQYRMILFGPHDENPSWSAQFHADGYRPFQDQRWDATADTAPLAICLAALKAVESKA